MPRSRAAVLDGTGQPRLEVREFEVPKLGADGEIVLRTVMCGVCGSDFHRYTWATHGPTILGHEILGVVEHAPADTEHERSVTPNQPFHCGLIAAGDKSLQQLAIAHGRGLDTPD